MGSFWIGALMLLICADVVSRTGFNHPLPAIAEIASYSVVGVLFLQLPAALLQRRLTRSDLLLTRLAHKLPTLYRVVESLFLAFSIAVFALLSRVSLHATQTAWRTSEEAGVPGIFSFPTWPLKTLIAVTAGLSVLALLVLLYRLWTQPVVLSDPEVPL